MLVECRELFDGFKRDYQKAVRSEGFVDPNSVIPTEPFITRKARTFLNDVLLKEKMAFGEQGQGMKINVQLIDIVYLGGQRILEHTKKKH